MLVKFVNYVRFLLAILLFCVAIVPAYADETQQTCVPSEQFYNNLAAKVVTDTENLIKQINEYNDHLQRVIFDENGPCYLLNMSIERDNAEAYGWSGFDLSGASNAGSEHSDEIKNLLSQVDFSNIDINLSEYEYKNDTRISAANIALRTQRDQEKLEKARQNLQIYTQCKAELFDLKQEQSRILNLRDTISPFLSALANKENISCSCKNGSIDSCGYTSETEEEEAIDGPTCKSLGEFAQSSAFCPTCLIFEKILMADQKLAGGAFGALSGALIKLLSLGFLIYLAIQTLILVSSPANQPMSKYLTSIVTQGFMVTVAVLLLQNPNFIFNLALKPILEGGLDFGITLTGGAQADIAAAGAKYTKFNTTDSLLSAPFLQKMVGTADVFNEQAAIMPALGRSLICNAFTNLTWNIFPNIGTMLEGLIITIFGFIVSLSVGFYLLDITVELGFFCCLLPFLIACWPFKITRNYCRTGWNIFMHIFFTYVMLGVIIVTINEITKSAISPNGNTEVLINALNANDFDTILEMLDIGGMQMLFLIVSCYICIKLLQDVNNLANKFAGGAGFNISSKLGGLAASATFAGAQLGGMTAFKGIMGGAEGIGALGKASGASGWMSAQARKAADKSGITAIKNKASQAVQGTKNLYNQALGTIGIGGQAKARGGRQGNNNNNSGGSAS